MAVKISENLKIGNSSVKLNDLAINFKNKKDGIVLYENSSGATNSLSCNDSLSNYNLIIIEWIPKAYTDYSGLEYTAIVSPSNKTYSKSNVFYNSSNNQLYAINVRFSVNDKNINIDYNQYGTVGANNAYLANVPGWGISKIIGFKW